MRTSHSNFQVNFQPFNNDLYHFNRLYYNFMNPYKFVGPQNAGHLFNSLCQIQNKIDNKNLIPSKD